MKQIIVILFLLGTFLAPQAGYCQQKKKTTFNPFLLEPADYSKVKEGATFEDEEGNTLKVIHNKYEKGLLIKITKDGKEKWVKHGMYYAFYADGSPNYKVPYQKGKREGLWQSYRSAESISYEKTYKNDVPHGPYYSYYRDGSLEEKGNYKPGPAKSEKDGEWLQYRDGPGTSQGPIMWKRYYEYGSREGTWSFYDHKGKLESTATYKNGKLVNKSN
jgi:antitoxin component YwqK of YwqJK toxin-antitoxin module